jgi:hypothetical protein
VTICLTMVTLDSSNTIQPTSTVTMAIWTTQRVNQEDL